MSKSQRNKGKRKHQPIAHGGVCSACGQTSTSAKLGTKHAVCDGFSSEEFTTAGAFTTHLNDYAKDHWLTADGELVARTPIAGTWITKDELEARVRDNGARVFRLLKAQRHCRVVLGSEPEETSVRFVNGLNEPIVFHNGSWCEIAEAMNAIGEEILAKVEEREEQLAA